MRTAVVLLFLLLAGLATWWSLGAATPPPQLPDDGVQHGIDRVDAAAADHDRSTTEATIERAGAEATADADALEPAPADAHWLEVQVIDRDSEEPVPHAEVLWANERQHERARELEPTQSQRLLEEGWHLVEALGHRTIADADGKVRVWCTDSTLQIVARHEGRYGYRALEIHEQTTEGKVAIAPDLTLRAHVQTAEGNDARGVMVGLNQLREKQVARNRGWSRRSRRTDDRGVATFEHVQLLQRWEWGPSKGQQVPKWTLQLTVPGAVTEPTIVDAQQPPDEPVEMQVCASGHLRVRPMLAGKPHPARSVRLTDTSDEYSRITMMRHRFDTDRDGWIEVRHVALGKTFSFGSNTWSIEVPGPTQNGETVSHEVELTDRYCALTARVLAADGEPVREQQVSGSYGAEKRRRRLWGRTDDQGRAVYLTRPDDDSASRMLDALSFRWSPKDAPIQQRLLGTVAVSLGVTELGDVQLETARPVVSGRIEPECPIDGEVRCAVMREEVYPDAKIEPQWRFIHEVQVQVADDLTFCAYGELQPGRYRIQCWADNLAPMKAVEFAPGATDVILRPRCGHPLQVQTTLPSGMRGSALHVVLKAPESAGVERREFYGELQGDVAGLADHRWKALPPGTYSLVMRFEDDYRSELIRVDDVQIPRAEGGPLQLDLRETLTSVALQLEVDTDTVSSTFFAFYDKSDATEWRGRMVPHGRSVLTFPTSTREVTFAAQGFHPKTVQVTGPELSVLLERRPVADVTVTGLDGLPENAKVNLRARPVPNPQGDERRYRAGWSTGKLADLLQGGGASQTLRDGKATLSIGSRPSNLSLSIWVPAKSRGRRRSVKAKDFTPKQIAAPGAHLLTVPPAELARLIEELTKPKPKK